MVELDEETGGKHQEDEEKQEKESNCLSSDVLDHVTKVKTTNGEGRAMRTCIDVIKTNCMALLY